jgi:hypothetical protein
VELGHFWPLLAAFGRARRRAPGMRDYFGIDPTPPKQTNGRNERIIEIVRTGPGADPGGDALFTDLWSNCFHICYGRAVRLFP